MKRRVVISGLGIVSPVGNTIEDFARSLREGISGKDPGEFSEVYGFQFPPVFFVKNFDPHHHGTHLLDPFIQYAVAAAEDAVKDAGFDVAAVDPYRIGLSVSSSKGGVHTLDRFKERFLRNPSAIMGARMPPSLWPMRPIRAGSISFRDFR